MDYKTFLETTFNKEFASNLLSAIEKEPISGLRLNPFKLPPINIYQHLEKHCFVKNGYLFNKKEIPLGKNPLHNAGAYYIQEPSAMMVAELLNIQPNDFVIDLCAAPGGKSTHAASFLSEDGFLLSNDINHQRALDLAENIERLGIKNAFVMNESIDRLANKYQGLFDKVILDAPCSGEGMFRKNQAAFEDWSIDKVERLSQLQKTLILDAYRLLKKGGYMIYSTCTFNPHENEEVIQYLLSNTNASLVRLPYIETTHRGINMEEAIRLFPTTFKGEGHFIALIQSNDEYEPKAIKKFKSNIDKKSLEIFRTFSKQTLNIMFDETRLNLNNNHLYYLPLNCLYNDGLRTLKSGLYLGEIKEKYFLPSHALALASKPSDWKRTIEFKSDSKEIIDYMKGLSFKFDGEDGYTLITCENLSIGFCKISKNNLKNFYPKNLRR